MVLEHIFPEDWLEQKGRYAFILGVVYSVVGILLASILFPGDPALVAIAFTSMLLLPEMYKLFSIEERKERIEQNVSLRALWYDDIELVRIYVFLFLGILLVYSVGAIMLPEFQTNSLFREQLEIRFGQGFTDAVAGEAFSTGLFVDLLKNNFLVLLACFILALLAGDGAIFLIVWNASVWGAIFGITARNAAIFSGKHAFLLFGMIMAIVFIHMILEALAYILAAIAGSVISKDVLLEQFASDRFMEVFSFNAYIIFFALVALLLGAGVETLVLNNVTQYQEIIQMSLQAVGR